MQKWKNLGLSQTKIKIFGKHPFKWQFYVFKNSKFSKILKFLVQNFGF